MPGLLRYLFGPGKADEHTDQRVLAGSSTVMGEWAVSGGEDVVDVDAWLFDQGLLPAELVAEQSTSGGDRTGRLSVGEAAALGRMMEATWRTQTLTALVGSGAPQGGRPGLSTKARYASPEGPHVYHVTLSLGPDEGAFTDEQWRQLAQDYVTQMGFVTDVREDSCEWAAVHHGVSAQGNDHIHVAVNLVRPTGERVSLRYENPETGKTIGDKTQTQLVRRNLERDHAFVTPLATVGFDARGQRATSYSRAEARRGVDRASAGTGHSDADRVMLERAVRGAAGSATTEAHFVSGLREAGVVVYPRYAKGSQEEVTGYSYALESVAGRSDLPGSDASFRIGGRSLSADLSLPVLRSRWAAQETARSREALTALWRDPDARLSIPSTTLEKDLQSAHDALERWNTKVDTTPVQDRAAWVQPTHHAAALIGMVAERAGSAPEVLELRTVSARLTQALRRDLVDQEPTRAPADPDASIAGRHLALAMRAGGLSSSRGWFAVLQQLSRTVRAIEDARAARGEGYAATTTPAGAFPAAMGWVDEHALTAEARTARAAVAHGRSGAGTAAEPAATTSTTGPSHAPAAAPERESEL